MLVLAASRFVKDDAILTITLFANCVFLFYDCTLRILQYCLDLKV